MVRNRGVQARRGVYGLPLLSDKGNRHGGDGRYHRHFMVVWQAKGWGRRGACSVDGGKDRLPQYG